MDSPLSTELSLSISLSSQGGGDSDSRYGFEIKGIGESVMGCWMMGGGGEGEGVWIDVKGGVAGGASLSSSIISTSESCLDQVRSSNLSTSTDSLTPTMAWMACHDSSRCGRCMPSCSSDRAPRRERSAIARCEAAPMTCM